MEYGEKCESGEVLMKISQAVNSITPSLTRELFNLAQEYDDVIDLTLGDPDIQPDDRIKEAACVAIREGKTRYSANAGLVEFRKVISEQFEKEYEIEVAPEKNVIVTVGGMEALYLSLRCLIDEGDEVIIPAPYYVNYAQMVRSCGGIPVIVNTSEESGFVVSASQIKEAITSKTVAMILNSPCNPTGQILGLDTLQELAAIAVQYDLAVISDEVYKSLVYTSSPYRSIATFNGMKERTIVVDSLSKRFAMTGYRIGYAIGPDNIIASMIKLQENVAACAALPSQYAGIAAYKYCANDKWIAGIFEKRCKSMSAAINKIENISCLEPVATFYLFVNIQNTKMDSITFARQLLKQQHVAVAPGITYGDAYDGFVRIACTLKEEILLEACDRIAKFVKEIH